MSTDDGNFFLKKQFVTRGSVAGRGTDDGNTKHTLGYKLSFFFFENLPWAAQPSHRLHIDQ